VQHRFVSVYSLVLLDANTIARFILYVEEFDGIIPWDPPKFNAQEG
jgi:hypothetical protein